MKLEIQALQDGSDAPLSRRAVPRWLAYKQKECLLLTILQAEPLVPYCKA